MAFFEACGPYSLDHFDGSVAILRRKPEHWLLRDNRALFSEVRLFNDEDFQGRFLRNGDTDVLPLANLEDMDAIRAQRKGLTAIKVGPVLRYLIADANGPLLRRYPALAHSLNVVTDRERLTRDILQGSRLRPASILDFGIYAKQMSSLGIHAHRNEIKKEIKSITALTSGKGMELKIAVYRKSFLLAGKALAKQYEELGFRCKVALIDRVYFRHLPKPNERPYDLILASETYDGSEPFTSLPFIVKEIETFNRNVFPTFFEKMRIRLKSDIHIVGGQQVLMDFNLANRKLGLIIPLYNTDHYDFFSNRVDISALNGRADGWTLLDIAKSGTNVNEAAR